MTMCAGLLHKVLLRYAHGLVPSLHPPVPPLSIPLERKLYRCTLLREIAPRRLLFFLVREKVSFVWLSLRRKHQAKVDRVAYFLSPKEKKMFSSRHVKRYCFVHMGPYTAGLSTKLRLRAKLLRRYLVM